MIRIALVLCVLWPLSAAAEWAPRPSMFSYEATFALCTSDPTARPQTENCADLLAAAYALKRAVLQAAYDCADLPLSECPAPLEDQGLPAIAARIASDIGCDQTPLAALPADTPLPLDHCINITADILIDEGVVPLVTEITCEGPTSECVQLADIQTLLWTQAAIDQSQGDPLVLDLLERSTLDCAQQTNLGADLIAFQNCRLRGVTQLWADLASQSEPQ